MRHRIRFVSIATALFAVLACLPLEASAAFCSANSECSGGQTCQTKLDLFVWKWRECSITRCNFPTDCPSGTACNSGQCQSACAHDHECASGSCVNSACLSPPGSSSGSSGTGIPGEGRKCNPADGSKPPDWALDERGKPLGACPAHTSCSSTGYCRKLQT